MIGNREDLETALEAVSAYLQTPPAPGSEDAAEFRRLLHEIDAYQPTMNIPASPTPMQDLATRTRDLVARAEALIRRMQESEDAGKLVSFPEDGQGIGPTTGV
ncbi:MAG: hypothetical protein KA220_06035 [Phenylobacterium sp.]|jgi:antitoxin component HigA of HigAB toxin-antitoxin module|nr:hypothetical protein [Phenylobacterium sp.]